VHVENQIVGKVRGVLKDDPDRLPPKGVSDDEGRENT
jgi:hypothetical protein